MVVDKQTNEGTSVGDSALCSACEMAVVWMKNQLNNQEVKEKVLEYVNQVISMMHIYFLHGNERELVRNVVLKYSFFVW